MIPNIPRLTRLIAILEALPARTPSFNISSYANHHFCGTTACAVGYAALDPELMAQGLRLTGVKPGHSPALVRDREHFSEGRPAGANGYYLISLLDPTQPEPTDLFSLPSDSQAACMFFGLTEDQFLEHFIGGYYPGDRAEVGPHDVATKLRNTFGIGR